MFVLKWIWNISQWILASLGTCLIMIIFVCLFSDIPNDLFSKLAVEQKIQKADAIVVLGAGVTESGWPGKFSLERTVKGVILYKQGYANTIIFSGGWDHDGYISSAKAMLQVAEDLGVPKQAILYEDKSHDTYENALFTSEILKEHKLNSVILVTSASHMRRSALVFNKLGISVYPAPAEEKLCKPELSWRSKIHNFSIMYQVLYETLGGLKYKANGWI